MHQPCEKFHIRSLFFSHNSQERDCVKQGAVGQTWATSAEWGHQLCPCWSWHTCLHLSLPVVFVVAPQILAAGWSDFRLDCWTCCLSQGGWGSSVADLQATADTGKWMNTGTKRLMGRAACCTHQGQGMQWQMRSRGRRPAWQLALRSWGRLVLCGTSAPCAFAPCLASTCTVCHGETLRMREVLLQYSWCGSKRRNCKCGGLFFSH